MRAFPFPYTSASVSCRVAQDAASGTRGDYLFWLPASCNCSSTRSRLKLPGFCRGGKSPKVVFADCDLEQAVAGAFHTIYFHGGQCCTAGSRLFVEEKVHGEFVRRIAERARGRKLREA
jgi:hypothetical protein